MPQARIWAGRSMPHTGKDVHVVLDNLSIHTTPEVRSWLEDNPSVHFHFTSVGSSWINQIETRFGIITRQSIRRGSFTSVKVLIKQIRDYIAAWNTTSGRSPGPPPPTRSWPKSASSKPTSKNSSTTTASKDNGITDH
ncbi:MAG TPA: transposase [Pseudonocardiaceae bacterium]|nr:transposase [Pseudonocardiaceae bacterium]